MTNLVDFDLIAKYYDLLYADRDDDIEMWLELTSDIEGEVLEIGCGTGRVLLPLLQNGKKVTGLEISQTALDVTQNKIKAAGFEDKATLHKADMRNFNIPHKSFAFAFIPINTFMHCLTQAEQLSTLQAIYKHLQPGGILVVDLYHPHPQNLLEADGHMYLENQLIDDLTNHIIQWFIVRHLKIDKQIQDITFILDEIQESGKIHRQTFSFPMRYLHRFEMTLLLNQAGFCTEQILGDYDLTSFYAESPRMIFIAKKQ